MRNTIAHLDSQIAEEKLKKGAVFCLWAREDRIELDGQVILYSELAEWIRDLHTLATATAQYKEPTPPGSAKV